MLPPGDGGGETRREHGREQGVAGGQVRGGDAGGGWVRRVRVWLCGRGCRCGRRVGAAVAVAAGTRRAAAVQPLLPVAGATHRDARHLGVEDSGLVVFPSRGVRTPLHTPDTRQPEDGVVAMHVCSDSEAAAWGDIKGSCCCRASTARCCA